MNTSLLPQRFLCQRRGLIAGLLMAGLSLQVWAGDTSPAEQLARFSSQAGRPGQAHAGQQFFIQKHGGQWSCASCHGERPVLGGKHASTGKALLPLAPAANPNSLTDAAKVDKWLRRNCKDLLSRECTAAEKADVLAWLISLKP